MDEIMGLCMEFTDKLNALKEYCASTDDDEAIDLADRLLICIDDCATDAGDWDRIRSRELAHAFDY